jgi:serine protease AprX
VNRRRELAIVLAISAIGLAVYFGTATTARSNGIYKIERRVRHDLASNGQASVVIYLKSQADLRAAYGMSDPARGWYVYRTLKEHAAKTQAPVIKQLQDRGVPYQSYWAANVIFTRGSPTLVSDLAARSDVAVIESNDASKWITDTKGSKAGSSTGHSAATVENGVMKVHAPELWKLGFTGQDIVVANQDTGVRWTHNALKPHYRGWDAGTQTADHNYNWHDSIHHDIDGNGTNPCGFDSRQPCDDNAHGTHTTGTAVGDDGAGNQIGVAPGAKWIGCHNMDSGTGRPETYTECFQFFIAPTDLHGQNPRPDLRPDVMNNSWGCPTSELCAADTLRQIVENTQAAGIFVEVSAGNEGPNCSTVNNPPSLYEASYSTAAVDGHQAHNNLAGFSSRGPVTVDGSNRIKPNIAAPGVNVRSSVNTSDTAYESGWSGTSMAGPHVVGVVALLWSAYPTLRRDIAGTKALLNETANPDVVVSNGTQCGGIDHVPNNHFGYGLVDVLAAYKRYTPPRPPPPPPPPKCVVPNVLRLKLAKAKARLKARHCRAGKITRNHSSARNRGRVIKQIPKASARKRPNGFRLKLTVGR